MNDKEKYLILAKRYFDAETSPQEELELSRYVAETDDPEFDELRGVLGFLSIGKQKRLRRARKVRLYSLAAAAACIIAVLSIGLISYPGNKQAADELCVRYAYDELITDNEQIMASVESSLSDFFSSVSPAETNLIEMFQR
ncbi:MAG: hypothetical protein IKX60_08640 [Bacteroidales bacterium]|nr:hypothetical protein [Bacteroidales bacterium]